MRAAQVSTPGGVDSIVLTEQPDPIDPDKVVIDIRVAGVSFPDLLMAQGRYQRNPSPPYIPGLEVAGTVRTAPAASGLSVGQRVAALTETGGWAEQVACPVDSVFPMPDGLPFIDAAAMVMNYLTVDYALRIRGRVEAGNVVLVHGAAGGLGSAAIQVAKGLGARVIAVVSSGVKADAARSAGADDAVDADHWAALARELVGDRGVDVVVDPVGGERFDESVRLLGVGGRFLVLGFAGGGIPSIALNRLLLRNIDLIGVAWGAYARPRPLFMRKQWQEVMGMWRQGHLRPVHGSCYSLEQAAVALRELGDRSAIGKVSLRIGPGEV